MAEVSGFPYFEVHFDKRGKVDMPDEVIALKQHIQASPQHAVIVLAHGWNNDSEEARRLYKGLLAELREALTAGPMALTPRAFAVLATLWPSKKFADENLVTSPAAALGGPISDAVLIDQIDTLQDAFPDDPAARAKLEMAKTLLPRLSDSPKARSEFATLVRSLLPEAAAEGAGEDSSDSFFGLDGVDLMERLAKPVAPRFLGAASPGSGARTSETDDLGSAAGFGEFIGGMKSAARNLLNYSTYYLMKQRSGTVGDGLNAILTELQTLSPELKIHLVGHSFGARLVTAAVSGQDSSKALSVQSMVLLQAAFSHNGFAVNFDGNGGTGAFRRVFEDKLVEGPTVISHTINDQAVGIAYPLASLISGTDAAWLGDANDPYGGLGRNGAQHTPEALAGFLLPIQDKYEFDGGKIYNLNADATIAHHGDIVHPEVAHAMVSAIGAAR